MTHPHTRATVDGAQPLVLTPRVPCDLVECHRTHDLPHAPTTDPAQLAFVVPGSIRSAEQRSMVRGIALARISGYVVAVENSPDLYSVEEVAAYIRKLVDAAIPQLAEMRGGS